MRADARNRLQIGVGIATRGRPEMVCAVIGSLRKQTRPPDRVVIASPDAPQAASACGNGAAQSTTWLRSPLGLTKQRNCILRESAALDVVVFFDDDFLPQPTYLSALEQLFLAHPDVVMATGHVIADGIIGPGFQLDEALSLLDSDTPDDPAWEPVEVYNGYGCNMAVRMNAVREGCIEFDETLPLYGWLEDVDFSRRLSRFGRVVLWCAARGVHLGTKSGRQAGIRLGYSQIANPLYLVRKGSMTWSRAIRQMSRNVSKNIAGALSPEPYIDRRGRLRGNAVAVKDLARGMLHPERILML